MALTTQIVLLCLCCIANSHHFDLNLFGEQNHHRIPLGLPSPFDIFPGMFDPPVYNYNYDLHKRPFTRDFKTPHIPEVQKKVSDHEPISEPPLTAPDDEDIYVKPPDTKDEIFQTKNVKSDEVNSTPSKQDAIFSRVNALSVHENPILSVKIPDGNENVSTEDPKIESSTAGATNESNDSKKHDEKDPDLTKIINFLLIPVDPAGIDSAINPISNDKINSNRDSAQNYNQGSYPVYNVVQNEPNGINSVVDPNQGFMNSNQPNQYGNGNVMNPQPVNYLPNNMNSAVPSNLYTVVSNPNIQGSTPNNMYPTYGNPNIGMNPNSPQLYNLIPINNGGWSQPNGFNPYNNQPNNFVPYNNQPTTYQPTYFNSVPNNFVPVNPQPNNFIPLNNNNYNPGNQPNYYIPVNNVPNYPINNQPNGIYSYGNQPNNFTPNNNLSPVAQPYNNGPYYVSVPDNNNNFVPYNQPVNFVPSKDEASNVDSAIPGVTVVDQPQPVNTDTLYTLKDKEGEDDSEKTTKEKTLNKENSDVH